MHPIQIISQIYATSGRKAKADIIKANYTNENFLKFLKYAMDDANVYGISETSFEGILRKEEFYLDSLIVGNLNHNALEWNDTKFDTFINTLIPYLLSKRTHSKEVIETVKEFFYEGLNPLERYFYYRCIIKNLAISIGGKTINDCVKKILIEMYQPMLADSGLEKFEKWVFEGDPLYMVDTKINGLRLTLHINRDFSDMTIKTRSGQRFYFLEDYFKSTWLNKEEVQASLLKTMEYETELLGHKPNSICISTDCELQHKDKTWESSISIINKDDVEVYDFASEEPNFYLHFFDITTELPFLPENFDTEMKIGLVYEDRRKLLERFIEVANINMKSCRLFKITDLIKSSDLSDVEALAKKAIENGFEGAVVKHPKSYYSCKRMPCWLKIKDIKTYEGKIVDILPGEASGKYSNVAGKIKVQVTINGNELVGTCGSGFKDEDRKLLWDNKESMIGNKIVEFTILGKTVTNNFQSGIFKRFRERFDINEV